MPRHSVSTDITDADILFGVLNERLRLWEIPGLPEGWWRLATSNPFYLLTFLRVQSCRD